MVMDKSLSASRNERWQAAFDGSIASLDDEKNRRITTAVMEHVMQVADVAHTMQPWHVYCAWNRRLFLEMAQAAASAADNNKDDPSTFWYQGELDFMDHYVIRTYKT